MYANTTWKARRTAMWSCVVRVVSRIVRYVCYCDGFAAVLKAGTGVCKSRPDRGAVQSKGKRPTRGASYAASSLAKETLMSFHIASLGVLLTLPRLAEQFCLRRQCSGHWCTESGSARADR